MNGWAKAHALVSDYLLKNRDKPGIKNIGKLLMPARKFLVGYKGSITSDVVVDFEKYLSGVPKKITLNMWAAADIFDKKIEKRRNLESFGDLLQSDVLVSISQLVAKVGGFDRFEKYLNIIKSIQEL